MRGCRMQTVTHRRLWGWGSARMAPLLEFLRQWQIVRQSRPPPDGCTPRWPFSGPQPRPRTQPRRWFAISQRWERLRDRWTECGVLEHFWVFHAVQRKLDHERVVQHATGSTSASASTTVDSTPCSTSCCRSYSATHSRTSCAGYIAAIWGSYIAVE